MKCIQDEIPFELPQGWEWCRLRNISSIISKGTTPKAGKNAYIDGDIGFVRIENLTDNYSISHEDMKYISNTTHINELKRSILQEHDLLITIAGTLGKTAVVRKENLPLNTNQAIAFIRFIDFEAINILFYCLIISSNTIKNRLLLQTKVTSIPNLTLEIISSCLIPLPPSHEQHRIVAKINELFVFVNTIESDKTDLQTTIQLAKSKILDLAIRGKLVPQNPDDEPASVLLERIRAEKEELIKQGKIKRDKKESVIFRGDDNSYYEKIGDTVTCIDEELPFDIPENWAWVRLQTCCQKEIKRGKSPKYAESSDTLVFAQKCNTKYDGINMELALYLDESTLVKYPNDEYMQDKDTVINSTGTGTLGRVGIYRKTDNRRGKPVVPDSHVTVIRANNEISAEYLYFFLKAYQQELEKLGEGSTNQKELKPLTLKNLIVALPPYAEQERIIEIITAAVEIMTNIEKSLS